MSKLVLVPTPIGNLKDISYRAIEYLSNADYILAEDTRVSLKLLNHYEVKSKLISFHQHNEHKKLDQIIDLLKSSNMVCMITDAGTPGISDPGFLLVREALVNEISVETLPGATAFVPALVNSGLPADRFIFEGFIPPKKGRQTKIKEICENKYTSIIYESPHRLLKTLIQLKDNCGGERLACVSREISKIHEENTTASLNDLIEKYSQGVIKGEIVIVLSAKD